MDIFLTIISIFAFIKTVSYSIFELNKNNNKLRLLACYCFRYYRFNFFKRYYLAYLLTTLEKDTLLNNLFASITFTFTLSPILKVSPVLSPTKIFLSSL